jgi:hypothetical protein
VVRRDWNSAGGQSRHHFSELLALRIGLPARPSCGPMNSRDLMSSAPSATKSGSIFAISGSGSGRPVIEVGTAIGLTDQLNAEANLGEGYSADVKLIKRTTGNERHNLLFGLGPPQFREDVRIEQPRHQNPESRTGIRSRPGSSPISLNGEACIASTSSAPVADAFSSDRPAPFSSGAATPSRLA